LIKENRQQSLSIARPRLHSSVFHGGIIRRNKHLPDVQNPIPQEEVTRNCLTLIEILWLCCTELPSPAVPNPGQGTNGGDTEAHPKQGSSHLISESSGRTLGCAVVEILTLDSLYNDVHWQEPEFRKVTTERDTLVWKRVEELPVLLSVIQEFSGSCVFLHYTSPVLRSLMGVVMSNLEVSREKLMADCHRHYPVAGKLIHCLTKGSLIVAPLTNVAELFPFVSPYEGYLLMLSIWRFIRDNPPSEVDSEVLKRTCDSTYTFELNSIIHANIETMGHLCSRIFNL